MPASSHLIHSQQNVQDVEQTDNQYVHLMALVQLALVQQEAAAVILISGQTKLIYQQLLAFLDGAPASEDQTVVDAGWDLTGPTHGLNKSL